MTTADSDVNVLALKPLGYWRFGPFSLTHLPQLWFWTLILGKQRRYTLCFGPGVPHYASRLSISTPTRGWSGYGKFSLPYRKAIRHLFS